MKTQNTHEEIFTSARLKVIAGAMLEYLYHLQGIVPPPAREGLRPKDLNFMKPAFPAWAKELKKSAA